MTSPVPHVCPARRSKGAKYKGSSADVAERCIKQLLRDIEKLESKWHGWCAGERPLEDPATLS